MSNAFTHFDQHGQAHMVDIGHKAETERIAVAQGRICMQAATVAHIKAGNAKKGDVLGIARIAAIQGAKRTADLIPLCHPIPLTRVEVNFDLQDEAVNCTVTTKTIGRTGVEMEALTAVSTALLTIYDMCKSIDRAMHIEYIQLLEKQGGQSGSWHRT